MADLQLKLQLQSQLPFVLPAGKPSNLILPSSKPAISLSEGLFLARIEALCSGIHKMLAKSKSAAPESDARAALIFLKRVRESLANFLPEEVKGGVSLFTVWESDRPMLKLSGPDFAAAIWVNPKPSRWHNPGERNIFSCIVSRDSHGKISRATYCGTPDSPERAVMMVAHRLMQQH